MRIQRIAPELLATTSDDVDLSLIEPIIKEFKSKKGSLIPMLQSVQSLYGYISRSAFEKMEHETNYSLSEMYGVATFYAQFRLQPVGKHIVKVCHGTACHVQNVSAISETLADELKIKDGETTEDGLFTLESVACLGCCSLAPVMMIGDDTFGKLTRKSAVRVVRNIKRAEKAK